MLPTTRQMYPHRGDRQRHTSVLMGVVGRLDNSSKSIVLLDEIDEDQMPHSRAISLSTDALQSAQKSSRNPRNKHKRKSLPTYLKEIDVFINESFSNTLKVPVEEENSKRISHDYNDMSKLPKEKELPRVGRGGVLCPFPEKLYEMLDDAENGGYSTIVSWRSHGRAFVVEKPKKFVDLVMPLHFRQTKLTSFQRQLNLYGFRRITKGRDGGAYYHEFFLRGRPDLLRKMIRKKSKGNVNLKHLGHLLSYTAFVTCKVKGTGRKEASNPDDEPDFYSMPQAPYITETRTIKDDQISICDTSLESLQESALNSSTEIPGQLQSSSFRDNPWFCSKSDDIDNDPTLYSQHHKRTYSISSIPIDSCFDDIKRIQQDSFSNTSNANKDTNAFFFEI